jgi:hypothetical protein
MTESNAPAPAIDEAEAIGRRINELAQLRIAQITELLWGWTNDLRQRTQNATLSEPAIIAKDDAARMIKGLDLAYEIANRMKEDLSRMQEVVAARTAQVQLETTVIAAMPTEELASLLLYLAVVAFGSGGIAYGLAGFPGLTLRLVPSLIVWGLAAVLFVLGYTKLDRWQEWKFKVFAERTGIPPPPS